jgi:hypothetical protein
VVGAGVSCGRAINPATRTAGAIVLGVARSVSGPRPSILETKVDTFVDDVVTAG